MWYTMWYMVQDACWIWGYTDRFTDRFADYFTDYEKNFNNDTCEIYLYNLWSGQGSCLIEPDQIVSSNRCTQIELFTGLVWSRFE